jgi:hypothetical protein
LAAIKNGLNPDSKFRKNQRVREDLIRDLVRKGGAFGIKLNVDQASALRISDSVLSLQASAWMRIYFDSVGDTVPNANRELEMHLERQEKLSIYEIYKSDSISVSSIFTCVYHIFHNIFLLFSRWGKSL